MTRNQKGIRFQKHGRIFTFARTEPTRKQFIGLYAVLDFKGKDNFEEGEGGTLLLSASVRSGRLGQGTLEKTGLQPCFSMGH